MRYTEPLPEQLRRRIRIIARALARNGLKYVSVERSFSGGYCDNTYLHQYAWQSPPPTDPRPQRRERDYVAMLPIQDGMTLRDAVSEVQSEIEMDIESMAAWDETPYGQTYLQIHADGRWEFWETYAMTIDGDDPHCADGHEDLRLTA